MRASVREKQAAIGAAIDALSKASDRRAPDGPRLAPVDLDGEGHRQITSDAEQLRADLLASDREVQQLEQELRRRQNADATRTVLLVVGATVFAGIAYVMVQGAINAMQNQPPPQQDSYYDTTPAPPPEPVVAAPATETNSLLDIDFVTLTYEEAGVIGATGVRVTRRGNAGIAFPMGIRAGDIITYIGTTQITDGAALAFAAEAESTKSSLSAVVYRDGSFVRLTSDAVPPPLTPQDGQPLDLLGQQQNSGVFGRWGGTYECERRNRDRTMEMDLQLVQAGSGVTATFGFRPGKDAPDGPSGVFTMQGTYDANTRRLSLRPVDWVSRDGDWAMSPVEAQFDSSLQTLSGRTNFSRCGPFTAIRIQ